MGKNDLEDTIREKYSKILPALNEKSKRHWAALEAKSIGRGGIAIVVRATGMSPNTVRKGLEEISEGESEFKKLRRAGGGRKKLIDTQKGLEEAIENIVSPHTRGDPENPLLWTSKSLSNISKALHEQGYQISENSIATILKKKDYSLQSNKKTKEGSSHEDRDAQFQFINEKVISFQAKNAPTISVDTKKKENIGEFKNNGQELCIKGQPIEVNGHDFPDKSLGKVAPYGIYDIGQNKGWMSVGISSDTAEFAVNSIRSWWYYMGKDIYGDATELFITADCGGSNGNRVRLWKTELQKLADETGLKIHVSHFPPGTSKWNKIEHKMFCYVSKNWRGRPLISREAVVSLIGGTRTKTGLEIKAILDLNKYEKGIEVSKEELAEVNIVRDKFHPEWNYEIHPRK